MNKTRKIKLNSIRYAAIKYNINPIGVALNGKNIRIPYPYRVLADYFPYHRKCVQHSGGRSFV